MPPNTRYAAGSLRHHIDTGTDTIASRDARDAYRVTPTTMPHTTAATSPTIGDIASSTPNDVAIPFPPRNCRNSDQLCPAIAASPAPTCTATVSPQALARTTAAAPLSMSTARTTADAPRPVTRYTLTLPMLPLPAWRMSVPVNTRTTTSPVGRSEER